MPANRTQRNYSVPALDKGLDILEALAVAGTPQTLADLARTLDRTSSEIFRMITVLEKRAYIAREPVSGGYRLTLKLFELSHTHSPVDQLLRAALPHMHALAESIRESCHLSILHRGQLLVIAQAESPEPVRLSVEVGDLHAPLDTASGRLLAAFLAAEQQSAFLAADRLYARMRAPERKALLADLREIRETGWFLTYSKRRTGVDIAVIVGNPRIGVASALGVPILPGGRSEGQERKLVPAIVRTADAITASLGMNREEDSGGAG